MKLLGHPELELIVRPIPMEREPLIERKELTRGVFFVGEDRPIPNGLIQMPLGADLLDDLLIQLLISALAALAANAGFQLRGIARSHARNAEPDDRHQKQCRDKKQDASNDVLKQRG